MLLSSDSLEEQQGNKAKLTKQSTLNENEPGETGENTQEKISEPLGIEKVSNEDTNSQAKEPTISDNIDKNPKPVTSKSMVDQMLEAVMTKYSSAPSLPFTSNPTAPAPNLKLKIKENLSSSTGFSISLDDPIDLSKSSKQEQQFVPKIKISNLNKPKECEETDKDIDIVSTHDENALDGLGDKSGINEPLIWKPVCNTNSNSSPKKLEPPPPLASFKTSLVDYSSNSSEKNQNQMETKAPDNQIIDEIDKVDECSPNSSKHKKKRKIKIKVRIKTKIRIRIKSIIITIIIIKRRTKKSIETARWLEIPIQNR